MVKSAEGTTAQHRRDRKVYNVWKKKNSITRITLLNSMENDIMREFKKYELTHEMWNALKEQFGATSVAKVKQLTVKFDTYKKCPNHNTRQHLREITNMVNELNDASVNLTTEQQVQAAIRSLPHNWEHIKIYLTHNVNIKTMIDTSHHLELEEDRIEVSKPNGDIYMMASSSKDAPKFKRKFSHK
ncbi:uncharacterized protein LOC127794746 [Diospyros lotus]|uniref:uncharacterized protein LOC127794746 n=1 Tax=Diospyros lotus TaxID=55363 RepID=UPI00224D3530|nr:uncharacterized protein LOC127794746 [Diospyros lotus]